jgi:flavodoxin
MRNPKVLVVYYSRTGTTKQVADAISTTFGCDVEEIVDTRNRQGVLGYLRAALDAGFRRLTTLKPTRYDPAAYDLVVAGTPVWNGSLSPPVRTYLTMHKGRLKHVAFFCTYGGSGGRRAFRQMADACGIKPLDLLDIREADVKHGEHKRRVHDFVASLMSREAAA